MHLLIDITAFALIGSGLLNAARCAVFGIETTGMKNGLIVASIGGALWVVSTAIFAALTNAGTISATPFN